MMIIGIDAHKRSHTAVTVDERGRQGAVATSGPTTATARSRSRFSFTTISITS